MKAQSAVLAVILVLAVTLAACGRAPQLPADDAATYQLLTGSGGQKFLRQISSHDWDDQGRAAAARLSWIARDSRSPDEAAAQRAGEAAHAIVTFLAGNKDELSRLPAGWFGLQHRAVGELNPELVRGYASALTPFQGALIGDVEGVRGFTIIGNPPDLSAARNVFAMIGTDTEAGQQFNDAAYQQVHDYLRMYAQAVADGKTNAPTALRSAAELAGVIEGGRRESGNAGIATRTSQYWINWAAYEVAVAIGAHPGDPDIPHQFFAPDGRLKPPDQVSANDLRTYSTAVENFAFRRGFPGLGSDFQHWYDVAAGK